MGARPSPGFNRSQDDVSDLWFHLYHNAYANNRSTHLWESGGKLRGVEIDSGWGWQRVTRLSVGGQDLTAALTFRAPDDAREDDLTVFSVDLPEPVLAGASLKVEIEWEAKIPRVRRRTGLQRQLPLDGPLVPPNSACTSRGAAGTATSST